MLYLLAAYVLVLACTFGLRLLNLRHLRLHGGEVPAQLEGFVDPEKLRAMTRYTVSHSRLDTLQSIVNGGVVLLFVFGGLLRLYDSWVATRVESFLGRGLVFFLLLFLAESLLRLPFSAVENFHVEKRFGFNRMGPRLWLTDLAKSLAISLVLLTVVITGALLLVRWSPHWWWLWVWGFFLLFTLFLMYISPVLIEPLFFKLEPVRVEGLEDAIRQLLARAELRASRVFQVDASRRSTHSNAYFTGIGKVKRIVLFDTLVERLLPAEILAVLAHEAGHWKLHHVFKRILLTELVALGAFYLAWRLVDATWLPGLFGLHDASFHARLLLLAFLGTIVGFPFTPLSSFLSRRHEWQADRFATELTGTPESLATALAKLARDNLSNLHPHPLYARFYYSHPPAVERLRRLQASCQIDA
jgi:STE24 endopeptidase